MSVLDCNRNGCENIMCDRFSYVHGYLCNECFDELVALGPWFDPEKFIMIPKEARSGDESTDSYMTYNEIFPLRFEADNED